MVERYQPPGGPGPRTPRTARHDSAPVRGNALKTTAIIGAGFGLLGLPLVAVVSSALGPFSSASPPASTAAAGQPTPQPSFALPPVDGGGLPGTFGYMYSAPSAPAPSMPAGAIPSLVLTAYQSAAQQLTPRLPLCHLSWPLLAGIGKVESNHADGGEVQPDGTAVVPILGPVLNGTNGNAAIHDTDHGVLDGDTVWDRAVGPMQILPSTWRQWATTTRQGATPNPENVFDATLTAGRLLCASGGDLSSPSGLQRAILAYNHSNAYLQAVLAWTSLYATEAQTTATTAPGTPQLWVPPPFTVPSTPPGTPSFSLPPTVSASPSASASASASPSVASPTPKPSVSTRPSSSPPRPVLPSPVPPAPSHRPTPKPTPTPTRPACTCPASASPTASPTHSTIPSPTPDPSPTRCAASSH